METVTLGISKEEYLRRLDRIEKVFNEYKNAFNELTELIRESAPLAWTTGKHESYAYEWEKKAQALLKKYENIEC